MLCARIQSALLSRDQTFHWPCSQSNGAEGAVPGSWHDEDINAFLFESDSRTDDGTEVFIVLQTSATHTPNKEQRRTKSKVGRHALPDHSLIESERERKEWKKNKWTKKGKTPDVPFSKTTASDCQAKAPPGSVNHPLVLSSVCSRRGGHSIPLLNMLQDHSHWLTPSYQRFKLPLSALYPTVSTIHLFCNIIVEIKEIYLP